MVKIINVLLICVLTLLFLSCTENPPTGITDNSTQSLSSAGAITFIPLPASSSLKKEIQISDSKAINAEKGGKLEVSDTYQGKNGTVSVSASLTVPKNALPCDETLTMTLGEETVSGSVDVIFGPHGTKFLVPALLNIDAHGLDLSMIPPNANVQLYYLNLDNNTYELMVVKKTSFDIKQGQIKCQDGQLPHFSRYAFGYVK
jgi:hypothetical protein